MIARHSQTLSGQLKKIFSDFSAEVCIQFPDGSNKTYAELGRLVEKWCCYFFEKDLKKGDVVCINLTKNFTAYAVALACIRYGVPFCFTDPSAPTDRMQNILNTCMPKIVVSDTDISILNENCRVVTQAVIDGAEPNRGHNYFEPLTVMPSDPAYVIFTSGSTGMPKGVTISQSNLKNFIEWAISEYDLKASDVHTHINPIYFDNSIFDIFSTFFSGASLVPFTDTECRDPYFVINKIKHYKCNILFSVPSFLRFLVNMRSFGSNEIKNLEKIIFGGEGYPIPELRKLYDLTSDHATLYNVYGPSECTCICSSYKVYLDDLEQKSGFAPIGTVSYNFDFYLRDDDGNFVGQDRHGELVLGGLCIGLGYLGATDLSASKFVTINDENGFLRYVYRTGDIFEHKSSDNKLYFVGRKDYQIKKQGYRIELEDIERAAFEHFDVIDSCCIFDPKLSRLVLVIQVIKEVSTTELLNWLKKRLPRYMVPDGIIHIDTMCKNTNGKTDRSLVEKFVLENWKKKNG
ncbi:AMP-binding protein [Amylibacter sp.]|nr:AMP-binding protein [Amylibacter sp.]